MAKELLLKVKEGSVKGSIRLADVEEILSDDNFTSARGLLTITEDGNTLIHLAAACADTSVLPLVCQAYKRAKYFPIAMAMANNRGHTPIHVAIRSVRFENLILLFKDCQELCPEALEPREDGLTLFHCALASSENLNMVKFFLSQEAALPMLLSSFKQEGSQPALPLDLAKKLVCQHERYVKFAEDASKNSSASNVNIAVGPKKKSLEKVKEMLSLIEQPTMELKAEQNKKLAKELERQKMLERQGQLDAEIEGLILAENWQEIEDKYLLAGIEETQKLTAIYLARKLEIDTPSRFCLPNLSEKTLRVLVNLMASSSAGEDVLLSVLKLCGFYTRDRRSNQVIVEMEQSLPVLPQVLELLCSTDQDLQCACAGVLSNFFNNLPVDSQSPPKEDSMYVQPLLLIKHFSSYTEAITLAAEALAALGTDAGKEPDPGTWSVQQVIFWMESNAEIENGSDYSKQFSAAGITGLHLLELSSVEMTGLGVKFMSHQRKLAACIDDLRRRNMRSMVGKRDIFLSYAHIDIKFARKIKNSLNEAGYSVWIDEAGIRAGHKWRNEIADGIQSASCVLCILSPRSANSMYCQDEIALAEELRKPILTIKYLAVAEIDPAIKLTLQRRQWLDFTDKCSFLEDVKSLVSAVHSIIGQGSGVESESVAVMTAEMAHSNEPVATGSPPSPVGVVDEGVVSEGVRQLVLEVLTRELTRLGGELRAELRAEIFRLDSRLDEIARRVDWK